MNSVIKVTIIGNIYDRRSRHSILDRPNGPLHTDLAATYADGSIVTFRMSAR